MADPARGQMMRTLPEESMMREAPAAIHYLDNDQIILQTRAGPLRLLGCTLWTDFWLFDDPDTAMEAAGRWVSDFRLILEHGVPLTPHRTAQLHKESRAWLAARFAEPAAGPTIVMSHHAPSPQSVPGRYRDNVVSAAFASDMEPIIGLWQPALWVHGHMHEAAVYQIGCTRVVCNPRGYVGDDARAARAAPLVLRLEPQ